MSEVVKISGRLGRLHVASSGPQQFEKAPQSAPTPVRGDDAAVAVLARQDVENLLEAEYRRGRSDGMREGRAAAAAECDARLQEDRGRADDVVSAVRTELEGLTGRLEHEAFRFAVAVAEKIVKREIAFDDEIVVHQIQESIRRVVGVESVRLRVNPRDEAMVRTQKTLLQSGTESLREIVIEVDDKVDRGGCILETPSGTVDARMYTQLEQIEAALFGQVAS